MSKIKISTEEKIEVVRAYLDGTASQGQLFIDDIHVIVLVLNKNRIIKMA